MFRASTVWCTPPAARGLSIWPKLPRSCPTHPTGTDVADAEALALVEALVGAVDVDAAEPVTVNCTKLSEYSIAPLPFGWAIA